MYKYDRHQCKTSTGNKHDKLTITLQLGREGTFTNPSTISLGRTINPMNLLRTNTQPGQNTTNTRITRRHIRICPKINVQHGSIGTLDQNLFAHIILFIGKLNGICHHGRYPIGNGLVILQLTLHINLQPWMGSHLTFGQFPKTHFEEIKVLEVADAYPVPTDFGSVRWADALFGGAYFVPTQSMLADPVDLLVEIKYQVSTIG